MKFIVISPGSRCGVAINLYLRADGLLDTSYDAAHRFSDRGMAQFACTHLQRRKTREDYEHAGAYVTRD